MVLFHSLPGDDLHNYSKWPVDIVSFPINSMVDLSIVMQTFTRGYVVLSHCSAEWGEPWVFNRIPTLRPSFAIRDGGFPWFELLKMVIFHRYC